MSSLLDVGLGVRLRGCEPRVLTCPDGVGSSGDEYAEYAERFGLDLLSWQRFVLRTAMLERADGRWAAREVALIVPRQNGKGAVLEARELAGLFLLDEQITHTAHEFKTAMDAFRRVRSIIDANDELSRRVSIIKGPNPTIEVKPEFGRGRLMFIARSGGSGRGFSGDLIVLDEAYDLTQDQMDALVPTLTTSMNPQIWYTSSAGKTHSEVLMRVRERGVKGAPTLAYMEYSVAEPGRGDPRLDPDDVALIAQANPSYPLFPDDDYLATEAGSLSYEGRLRERLGVWDGAGSSDLIRVVWPSLADVSVQPLKPVGDVAFSVHSRFDRSATAIVVCGARADGRVQVQVVESRLGVTWAVGRLVELQEAHRPCAVAVDPRSAVGSLIPDLEDARVVVTPMTTQDVAQAFGMFHDAAADHSLVHLDQPELNVAVAGSSRRPIGEAWTWDGKRDTDIKTLVGATNALWGWTTRHGSGALQIF